VTVHIVLFHSRLPELTSLLVLQEQNASALVTRTVIISSDSHGARESNFAVEQTAGSHSLAAAPHRERCLNQDL
jgi:hypothetical protein